MSRTLLVCCLLGAVPVAARAQGTDLDLNTPYHLRIALKVAEHPQLTAVFKDRLRRELGDSLQAALGALAHVEVVDLQDPQVLAANPLLREVDAKGLGPGLEGELPVTGYKTHFVFVDLVNGQYEIRARQHDGLTGLASAVVRYDVTPERLLVARSAARLVMRDFGIVGVIPNAEGANLQLQLKGGRLGVPLQEWVRRDEVFAIARLTRSGTGLSAQRIEWALLRVLEPPKDGVCSCRLFHRFTAPLKRGANVVGFRCLKLGTVKGSVTLRFVTPDQRPAPGLQVRVSASGFNGDVIEETATLADGTVQLKRDYAHLAFVRVERPGGTPVQLPVEIIPEKVVKCVVNDTAAADVRGIVELDRRRWINHLYEALQEETELVKEVNAKPTAQERLRRAETGAEWLKDLYSSLNDEMLALRARGREVGLTLDLEEGRKALDELEARRQQLLEYIEKVKKIAAEEKDPKLQRWRDMVEQAASLEREARFDEAIRLYQQVLEEGSQDEKLKKKLEQLRSEWLPKNEEHKKARTLILERWPAARDVTDLLGLLPEVQRALETCIQVEDRLTPRLLLKGTLAHVVKLNKEIERLQAQLDEDSQRELNKILSLVEGLKQLQQKVQGFVTAASSAGKSEKGVSQ